MGAGGSKIVQQVSAVEVAPADVEKGLGEVRRSSLYQSALVATRFEGVNTLADVFNRGHSLSKSAPVFVRAALRTEARCTRRGGNSETRHMSACLRRAGGPSRRMAPLTTSSGSPTRRLAWSSLPWLPASSTWTWLPPWKATA